MNKSARFALVWMALLLGLAACASQPLAPTPTAIPLQATATLAPRPTPLPTPLPPGTDGEDSNPTPTVGVISGSGEPSAGGPAADRLQINALLAQRTARAFLDHLVAGEADTARRLYLTTPAREGDAGQLVVQLASGSPDLVASDLLEFRRTTPSSYEARVQLTWDNQESQTLTLILAYERGLWLVDRLFLGDRQALAPTGQAPAAPPRAATRPAGEAASAAAAAGRLVFQASSGGGIYVVNADGSGLRRVTDGLDPAWSPDGRRIAFTRWNVPRGVYLVNAVAQEGQSDERRVVDGNRLKEVAWDPDGSRVAFTVNFGSSEPTEICFFGFCFTIPPYSFGQLWLANLDTGEFLSLPLDDRVVHSPAWSPTGERIVYAGEQGLAWIDLDGMDKGRFASSSVWDNSPAFSPDGQQIAFMGRAHDRWEIMVMQADGSGRRQLTHSERTDGTPANSVAPTWSPDGSQIAFLSDRDGPWRIHVMAADGSSPRSLFGDKLDELALRYEFASERVMSWTR